jgi:transaldolase
MGGLAVLDMPADQLAVEASPRRQAFAGCAVKIFMDGARIEQMKAAYAEGVAEGFTTNPTLMRQAQIPDYEKFAREAIAIIPDLPISFEVFSDDLETMEKEARKIASWGGNTYIKIPVTNTQGMTTAPLIHRLSEEGYSLNVTAVMTVDQVKSISSVLNPQARTIISVFAGRIADTGRDPIPIMTECADVIKENKNAQLLWASPRELVNIIHAQQCGAHIITATPDIIRKMALIGKDLGDYSLETVKMFYNDARAAGYSIV